MEWKKVKQELPICNKKAFKDTEGGDVNWLQSDIVLVVVNQIRSKNKYITLGRIDEYNDWWKEEEEDYFHKEEEEVTHWLPLPELPITETNQ